MAEKQPFMETTRPPDGLSELAVAGSAATPADVSLPVTSTLHDSRRAFQKVEVADPETQNTWFFGSGFTAVMEDQKASLYMTEKAMSVIKSGTGSFGFRYTKDVKVKSSCFENNPNFVLRHSLGGGVSGVVTAFTDKDTKHKFVRKRLKAESLRLEEVQSMLKLKHPGVCQAYALLCQGSTVDLLLQDAGYPLRDCLQKFCKEKIGAKHYWQVVQDLGRQGFEALHYVHQQGICHLDLKPENILLHQKAGRNLVLVLADFGSSLSLQDMMTLKLQMTPEYWAPEIWQRVGRFLLAVQSGQGVKPEAEQFAPSPAMDTFAMGLVLYFMAVLQHFVLAELNKKDNCKSMITPREVEHLCQQFDNKLDAKFAFNFLLMTEHVHRVPDLAASGHWQFDGIPRTIQEVMKATLNPDPDSRWTDEQAACYLSGCTGELMKTPTAVVDSTDHSEGDTLGVPPLPPPAKVTQATSAVDPVPPVQRPFSGIAHFQEKLAPLLKAWDILAPSHPTSQQNAKPVTNVPSPPATQFAMPDDIALPRPPLEPANGPTLSRRLRLGGLKAEDWQGPDVEENIPGEDMDVDMKENVWAEQLLVQEPSGPHQDLSFEEKGKGSDDQLMAEGGRGGGYGNSTGQGFSEQVWSPRSKVANKMGALSIHPETEIPRPLGKGGGYRRSGKPGGEVGKEGRSSHKGVAQSAPMKVGGGVKKGAIPHKQKRLPPELLKADPPVAKIPFVVASSGRRNPSTHTLHGSSVGEVGKNAVQNQLVAGLADSSTVAFLHQGFGVSEHQATASAKAPSATITEDMQQLEGGPGKRIQPGWFSERSRLVLDSCACGSAITQPQEQVQQGRAEAETMDSISMDEAAVSELMQLLQGALPAPEESSGSVATDMAGRSSEQVGQGLGVGAEAPVFMGPPAGSVGVEGWQGFSLTGQGSSMIETPPGQADGQAVAIQEQAVSFGPGQLGWEEGQGLLGLLEMAGSCLLNDTTLVQGALEGGGASQLVDTSLGPIGQQILEQGGLDGIEGASQQTVGQLIQGHGEFNTGVFETGGAGQGMGGGSGSGNQQVCVQVLAESDPGEGGNVPNFDVIFD